jgi:hypothetical protein
VSRLRASLLLDDAAFYPAPVRQSPSPPAFFSRLAAMRLPSARGSPAEARRRALNPASTPRPHMTEAGHVAGLSILWLAGLAQPASDAEIRSYSGDGDVGCRARGAPISNRAQVEA